MFVRRDFEAAQYAALAGPRAFRPRHSFGSAVANVSDTSDSAGGVINGTRFDLADCAQDAPTSRANETTAIRHTDRRKTGVKGIKTRSRQPCCTEMLRPSWP